MTDFRTCLETGGNYWPSLITFLAAFGLLLILTNVFKSKVLYVTLLPARVIILGVLWSETPGKESIQLDMSFNEVSVSVMFIILIKNFIESRYGKKNGVANGVAIPCCKSVIIDYKLVLLFCSIVALIPAIAGIVADARNQYAMGILSTVVVILLLTYQHKQTRPTEEINLGFPKILVVSLLIAALTLVSSFADCLGFEGWVGLICAYPIDSVIILWQFLDAKETSTLMRQEHLSQIVYLIALSCYVHYTMTVIIWSSSKVEFLKHIQDVSGVSAIVPLLCITAVSGLIVFSIISSVGFLNRIKRTINNLTKESGRLREMTSEASSPVAKKLEMSGDQHHIYEMGSLRL